MAAVGAASIGNKKLSKELFRQSRVYRDIQTQKMLIQIIRAGVNNSDRLKKMRTLVRFAESKTKKGIPFGT